MTRIDAATVTDLRFPTSRELDGSDAMNPDPDYSAAYLRLGTSDAALTGHGFVFTIGRGNDVQAAAVRAVAERLVGRSVDGVCEDPGAVHHELSWDSQLRWLGPDKGVMHMAVGAVMNAVWDLRARRAGVPLWRMLGELEPAQLVGLVDWTYLVDFLDPAEAREQLEDVVGEREGRLAALVADGMEAYTTSPGWMGYDDDKLQRLCVEAEQDGFTAVKLKVGAGIERDRERLELARGVLSPAVSLAVDANQRWSVPEAVEAITAMGDHDLRWVEEPTHPDDVVGHATIARQVAPVPIATGEHLANPVLAKQLLQLDAASILQVDATRVGGVHDLVAMLLLARHGGATVIPHAGGVGLCEVVQHVAFFNALAVAPTTAGLAIEYADHLHEHMVDPVQLDAGRYRAPASPGMSAAFTDAAIDQYRFPDGSAWVAS